MNTVTACIAAALTGIGAYFTWKASAVRQRRLSKADVEHEKELLEMKKEDIRNAVYSNDDDELNRIVSKLVSGVLVCVAFGTVLIGCAAGRPKATVYIPTDRRIETVTNSIGIVCKAVPNAVMVEMLERLQELKDLKDELKVDKRVLK